MCIDFELLKRTRTIDPFTFTPLDIEQSMAFTGEVMRDNARTTPEVLAATGAAICRVKVTSPTSRLRQRLAVLRWLPLDPASDGVWYLDEPVELATSDNYLVSNFVAQYYAEGMNLLFAPDDGLFTGGAFHLDPSRDASPAAVSSHLKLMVERVYVSEGMVAPNVPVTVLARSAGLAIMRANAARIRADLQPLVPPSRSTVSRWMREFQARHVGRSGLGAKWRRYEPLASSAPDDAGSSSRARRASRSGG